MQSWIRWSMVVLAGLAVSDCATGGGGTPSRRRTRKFHEDESPQALTWVAPDAEEPLEAQSPIDLVVSTGNPMVSAVHFKVDGMDVGVCNGADPAQDCHADTLWGAATTFMSPGMHTLQAVAKLQNGMMLEATPLMITVGDAGAGGGGGGGEDEPESDMSGDADPVDEMNPMSTCEAIDDPEAMCELDMTEEGDTPTDDPNDTCIDEGDPLCSNPEGEVCIHSPELCPPGSADPACICDGQGEGGGGEEEEPPLEGMYVCRGLGNGFLDPRHGYWRVGGGQRWALRGQRVIIAGRGKPQGPVTAIEKCMTRFGASFIQHADANGISRASLVALAIAETGCRESVVANRPGPMRPPVGRCRTVTGMSASECRNRMRSSPDFNIRVAAEFLGRRRSGTPRRSMHRSDPVRTAAIWRVGTVRESRAQTARGWRMLPGDKFINKVVLAYNAYRTWVRKNCR